MTSPYQALPILAETFVGVALNEATRSNRLIRAEVDGDITFHYPEGDITITAGAGDDYVTSVYCTGVTSISSIIMS